jgi:hypothetical protein
MRVEESRNNGPASEVNGSAGARRRRLTNTGDSAVSYRQSRSHYAAAIGEFSIDEDKVDVAVDLRERDCSSQANFYHLSPRDFGAAVPLTCHVVILFLLIGFYTNSGLVVNDAGLSAQNL